MTIVICPSFLWRKIMAKVQKINESFTLSFNSREDQSGDTVADIDIRFDNPKDDSVLINRLNTWLKAIGREDIVVSPKPGM